MRFQAILRKFARDRGGATATEYALIIALIAFLSVAALGGIGDALKSIFQYINGFLAT